MKTKIAPTLRSVAEETIAHFYGDATGRDAAAELRALLAVAKAARLAHAGRAFCNGAEYGCGLCEAIARLDRKSRARRSRGAPRGGANRPGPVVRT